MPHPPASISLVLRWQSCVLMISLEGSLSSPCFSDKRTTVSFLHTKVSALRMLSLEMVCVQVSWATLRLPEVSGARG